MAKGQQKRLGKGLGALLGDYLPDETDAGRELTQLPLSEIRPNPYQPRQEMDQETLRELAASIKQNGLLQPIVVRSDADGAWQVVAGERRLRAVQELGWAQVPVLIRDVDDRTMLVLALIENLQREDLSPIDEARAYRRLVEEFSLTQSQVAERVGRDRSTIANTLRLLGLPQPVQDLLSAGRISAGHARALLGLDDASRVIALARTAAERGLSVREVERRVRKGRDRAGPDRGGDRKKPTAPSGYVGRAERALSRALGTAVSVKMGGAQEGRIEIPFQDAEDFERIVEIIVGVGGIV